MNVICGRLVEIVFAILCTSHALAAPPKALDERLTIDLFAAEPDIVTPTGIAVDDKGRVFAIESHTHFRPDGYKGPAADRIRVYEDTNNDGRADRITTFFEGTSSTMNLAFHPDGSLYVATRMEIFRLRDADSDGKADERTPIAHLDTKGNYPHNGLSGFAFDFAGIVYFGFGENLGEPYKLIGSDKTALSGGGEGGGVYCCHADGSKLRRIATGFWNPFHVATDSFGRLFAVDNDPDSSPPCRLLHIVEGGDYGYRFRLGRDGLHPYQSWNGEIPGTLPMIAGTGEAPSGMIVYESDGLPSDYLGDLLITSWGDHRIERHRLVPRGASYSSKMTTIVQGGEDFRPVGIALAPDGSLYLTDWVKRDYHLHRHGRIWRLRSKATPQPRPAYANASAAMMSPHRPVREAAARELLAKRDFDKLRSVARHVGESGVLAQATAVSAAARELTLDDLQAIANECSSPEIEALVVDAVSRERGIATRPRFDVWAVWSLARASYCRQMSPQSAFVVGDLSTLLDAQSLDFSDPFLAQAARLALVRLRWRDPAASLGRPETPELLLMKVLVQRELGPLGDLGHLKPCLNHPDERIRCAALQWIGEARITQYREQLGAALTAGPVTRRLFDTYLATLEALDNRPAQSPWDRRGEAYIAALALEDSTPLDVRRMALRLLRPDHRQFTAEAFDRLWKLDDEQLRLELVRSLRESRVADRGRRLLKIAADPQQSSTLRAEAVMGLAPTVEAERKMLLDVAAGKDPTLQAEALRSLRNVDARPGELTRLTELPIPMSSDTADLSQRTFRRQPSAAPPPTADIDAWEKLVTGTPNAAAGERIFSHPQGAGCYRCHQVAGRGGRVGPDLTVLPQGMTRRRLLASIVQPSREVAPQYVPWQVLLHNGTSFTGVFLGEDGGRHQRFADAQGKVIAVKADDIELRRAAETSIMPDDTVRLLTPGELRDVMAFLLSPRR